MISLVGPAYLWGLSYRDHHLCVKLVFHNCHKSSAAVPLQTLGIFFHNLAAVSRHREDHHNAIGYDDASHDACLPPCMAFDTSSFNVISSCAHLWFSLSAITKPFWFHTLWNTQDRLHFKLVEFEPWNQASWLYKTYRRIFFKHVHLEFTYLVKLLKVTKVLQVD